MLSHVDSLIKSQHRFLFLSLPLVVHTLTIKLLFTLGQTFPEKQTERPVDDVFKHEKWKMPCKLRRNFIRITTWEPNDDDNKKKVFNARAIHWKNCANKTVAVFHFYIWWNVSEFFFHSTSLSASSIVKHELCFPRNLSGRKFQCRVKRASHKNTSENEPICKRESH